MEVAKQISEILKNVKERNGFTDQQLAEYVGISRWTIYRINRGDIGETVSTKLVDVVLRERPQPTEQAA